ncbi:hypothetical protein EYF80_028651 [Liparis tanakae]|uniref:Uncharacterized protein n=1 Tax=Liparis tanakae TaxID=230148 RepID=A0A4Z2H7Z2_9TELE|nr:hypothetical protein EYF80_028651 [Liparis tanakae]
MARQTEWYWGHDIGTGVWSGVVDRALRGAMCHRLPAHVQTCPRPTVSGWSSCESAAPLFSAVWDQASSVSTSGHANQQRAT